MDKKEIDIQKALGTIKKATYSVAFTFRRKNDPKGKLRFYQKRVLAYAKEDAIKKVLGKFSTDSEAGPGQYKTGVGCHVVM